MKETTREIDSILNIEPIEISDKASSKEIIEIVSDNYELVFPEKKEVATTDPFDDDFNEVRQNIKDLIQSTSDSVEKLAMIANETEKGMDFQALATLTKVLLDANKQLLDIFQLKKSYTKTSGREAESDKISKGVNIQNAAFFGTTQDLKKHLDDLRKI